MFSRIITLFNKDLLLELRQKHTFYGILLYISSTIFVLYLALTDSPESNVWNSLFWVIQLFICVNTVAKSFLQESRGRMLYFYSIASPVEFILAKLMFNMLLMIIMTFCSLLIFIFFILFYKRKNIICPIINDILRKRSCTASSFYALHKFHLDDYYYLKQTFPFLLLGS